MSEEQPPMGPGDAFQEFARKMADILAQQPPPAETDRTFYTASLFILLFNYMSRIEYCHWCAMKDGKEILHNMKNLVPCEEELAGKWTSWTEMKSRFAELSNLMVLRVQEGKLPYLSESEAEEHMVLTLLSVSNIYNIDMFKIANKVIKTAESLDKGHQPS